MNAQIAPGIFFEIKRTYRSKDGRHYFAFKFIERSSHIDIYSTSHPSLNGRGSNPSDTHLFRSGKLCFVAGREPRSLARAEQLAAQWAEYFCEYRRTGKTQR